MGCCEGMVTEWLAGKVEAVTAVEPIPVLVERCRQLGLENVTWVCGTTRNIKEAGFDLAIICEVLEHCIDPEAEMERLRGMAKVILASVPIAEMPNENAFDVDRHWNPQRAGDGSGHIWCFREDTFKALFQEVHHFETDGISAIIVGR